MIRIDTQTEDTVVEDSGYGMDVLLLQLGTPELFGIDVKFLKEVTHTGVITPTFRTKIGIVGVVALRGEIIPVIDLNLLLGLPELQTSSLMMVTEIEGKTQAFLIEKVDRILNIPQKNIQPIHELSRNDAFFSGVAQIESTLRPDQLVSILALETITAPLI